MPVRKVEQFLRVSLKSPRNLRNQSSFQLKRKNQNLKLEKEN